MQTAHLTRLLTDDAALRALPTEVRNALLDAWRDEVAEQDAAEAHAEWLAEQRYERWLEDGGPMAEVIAWENQRDLDMAAAWL